jgi:LmbE family N-acetylglucosaminyl deacetylase
MNKCLFTFLSLTCSFYLQSQEASFSSNQIQLNLEQLNTLGKVLYIAAHPDDENTRLLAYLANERKYTTAYLSVTRGDGGQNLVGTEQGEELGMIRTQELLAARRVDGAQQFFTRANDFGFSKNPEETFRIWGKEAILADVVWAIRKFRPDVIITRFPTTGEGGHGHHTASALLAVEAFTAAADPSKFPEQMKLVQTWQAKRLFWNNFIPAPDSKIDLSGLFKLDVGSYLPLLGKSIGELAAESRSQHKSQGFGVKNVRGELMEYFTQLAGDKVEKDIFEGIQTDWNRISNTKGIAAKLSEIIHSYMPDKPEASISQLSELLILLKNLPDSDWKTEKITACENLLLSCSGFFANYVASTFQVAAGSSTTAIFSCVRRTAVPVEIKAIHVFPGDLTPVLLNKKPGINRVHEEKITFKLSNEIQVTNPYWLAKPHQNGIFQVDNQMLVGLPESPPVLYVQATLVVNGNELTRTYPLMHQWVDPIRGELSRSVEVIPKLTAKLSQPILTFTPVSNHSLEVELESFADSASGIIRLGRTDYWYSTPEEIPVRFNRSGEKQTFKFQLRVSPNRENRPEKSEQIPLLFEESGKISELNTVDRIRFDHIPIQTWTHPAYLTCVYLGQQPTSKHVGYIKGAGDEVGMCLRNAGFQVTELSSQTMKPELLAQYDAIITGIRAFNTNENLAGWMPMLLKYVENGGVLIEQYNTRNRLSDLKVQPGPFPFEISRDRITDEKATMTILVKDHPVFNYPNQITDQDFEGWVQERGVYFPEKWDSKYLPLLACNDPGEAVKNGSLLVCEFGKGKFVYTGLSFFRQLPAGVPGAYKLLVNLLSWGDESGK